MADSRIGCQIGRETRLLELPWPVEAADVALFEAGRQTDGTGWQLEQLTRDVGCQALHRAAIAALAGRHHIVECRLVRCRWATDDVKRRAFSQRDRRRCGAALDNAIGVHERRTDGLLQVQQVQVAGADESAADPAVIDPGAPVPWHAAQGQIALEGSVDVEGLVLVVGNAWHFDHAAIEEHVLAKTSAGNLIAVRVVIAVLVEIDRIFRLRHAVHRIAGDLPDRSAFGIHRRRRDPHIGRQLDRPLGEHRRQLRRRLEHHLAGRVEGIFRRTKIGVIAGRAARCLADTDAVIAAGMVQVKVDTGSGTTCTDIADPSPGTDAQGGGRIVGTVGIGGDWTGVGPDRFHLAVGQAEHQRGFFIAGAVGEVVILGLAVALFVLSHIGAGIAAFHRPLQDDVDHAGDGVRAIDRRGAVLQHFDPLDHCRRHGRQVGVPANSGGPALAVDQHQQALCAEVAQVDVLPALLAVRSQHRTLAESRCTGCSH